MATAAVGRQRATPAGPVGSSHAVSKPVLKALSWSLLAAGGRTAAHARLALRDCELAIHLCATPPDEAWEWVEPAWRRRLDDMGWFRELPDLVRALQVAAISGAAVEGSAVEGAAVEGASGTKRGIGWRGGRQESAPARVRLKLDIQTRVLT